jgi:O-antigen ligase
MNRALHTALLLLVVLAPLPLGSNREWSWTACALLAGVIALAWSLRALSRPNIVSRRLPTGMILLFLVACGWVLVQASPLTPAAWQHPLWPMSAAVTGLDPAATISLSREDSLVALMRLLSYGLVFFLSFQLARDGDRARAAFTLLAAAGLVYAVFGLATFWGEFEARLWFREQGAHMAVRGPFVNRNSFATYLGLSLLCLLALFYQRLALRRNPLYTAPRGRQQRIEEFILQAWKPLAMVLLMTSALILTYSRAGFGSFMLGALALVLAVHHRRKFSGKRSAGALVAAFAVTITAFLMTSEVLLQRMDQLDLDAPGRLHVYALAGAATEDNPWLGFGYGTFADSFRLYRDDSLTSHYDMAHNTWIENLFELGWPAAMALFGSITWAAGMCLAGLRRRGRDWIYPATGLAASLLVALHSFFDFSLQMPAVALTFACLLGTACAQSVSSSGQR